MYKETSSISSGYDIVFCSFGRTDKIIIIIIITLYYNKFSIVTDDPLKSRGRFIFQLLLQDGTWSARYKKPKRMNIALRQLIGL